MELFLIALISVFFFFLFPRFHGLIQFCKSGEDCGIKRLRLKPCTQVSAFAEDRASLSFEVGRRGPDDPLGKLHRVEALGVQRHRTETLCQVSFLNFTAVLKWSQAEEHCENLFISQYPRPLTLCSPGYLWRSLGPHWPKMRAVGLPCLVHLSSVHAD